MTIYRLLLKHKKERKSTNEVKILNNNTKLLRDFKNCFDFGKAIFSLKWNKILQRFI